MNKGYLFLVLASLCYASMGVLVKVLSIDTGPYLQTFLRLVVSLAITALIVLARRKPLLLKHPKDYLLMFFMGSIGFGLQIILYTLAIYHNTISNTLFVMSAYPIVTAILAYFVLKEHITKRLWVAFILLACALFLLFDPTDLGKYLLGNTYALGVACTFAFYVICSRIMSKRGNSAETITLWSVGLAVLVSGLATQAFETITLDISTQSILFLVLFGLLNASAFNFINKGFSTVNASVGTIVLLLEPIIGSLLGLFFFQEIPSLLFMLGAIIMIIAIYLATFKLD